MSRPIHHNSWGGRHQEAGFRGATSPAPVDQKVVDGWIQTGTEGAKSDFYNDPTVKNFLDSKNGYPDSIKEAIKSAVDFIIQDTQKTADANHDGKIDQKESSAYLNALKKSLKNLATSIKSDKINLDDNRNGKIDGSEVDHFTETLISDLADQATQTIKDGFLNSATVTQFSEDGFPESIPTQDAIDAAISAAISAAKKTADTNNNGKMDGGELTTYQKSLASNMQKVKQCIEDAKKIADQNQNGKIDPEEFAAFEQAFKDSIGKSPEFQQPFEDYLNNLYN